jgi:hypothetical protein
MIVKHDLDQFNPNVNAGQKRDPPDAQTIFEYFALGMDWETATWNAEILGPRRQTQATEN